MSEVVVKELKRAAPNEKLFALRLKRGTYQFDVAGELEKRCGRCKEYWPADSEFFYAAKTPDGLWDWCKACYIENRFPNGRNADKQRSHEVAPGQDAGE